MPNVAYGHVVLGVWHRVPVRTGLHMGDDHLSWNEKIIGLADRRVVIERALAILHIARLGVQQLSDTP